MNDFSKQYIVKLNSDQTDIIKIAEEVKSLWTDNWQLIFKNKRGFMQIKPFLLAKRKAILGSNTRHWEFRISIRQDENSINTYTFILLISHNTPIRQLLFYPLNIFLAAVFKYLIFRLKNQN